MGIGHGFIDAVLHKNLSDAEARFFSIRQNMKNGPPQHFEKRGERKKAGLKKESYEMYTQKQIDQALSKYEEVKSAAEDLGCTRNIIYV